MTGYLRAKLNITLVDTGKYQRYNERQVLKRKALLKPNLYLNDLINTLVGRGEDQMKVGKESSD